MVRTAIFCAALLAAAPASAQDQPEGAGQDVETTADGSGFDISGDVTLMSDYRFRGVSRSDEDPAVQAAATLSHGSGLYAGARGTSLKGLDSFRLRDPAFGDLGDAEIDLYAGYRTDLGGGFDVDAGALYYVFAGGERATDYVEPYASLSWLIGPLYATAGVKYAPSQRAIGNEDMLYLFAQADVSIPFRPWRFSALIGRQEWGSFGSYWTWSLGIEHRLRLGGLPDARIGLRYVDTDLPSAPGLDAGAVLSLGFDF